MSFINIEIKARTNRSDEIRSLLIQHNAEFKGTDNQQDTYFNVPKGRLKLREGNIENALIYYEREDHAGPKTSNFNLAQVTDGKGIRETLTKSLGVKVVVLKKREIYYIDNVKFHLDTLGQLGNFVEIEASNKYRLLSLEQLREQCDYYIQLFGIAANDMVHNSYSDMLLEL